MNLQDELEKTLRGVDSGFNARLQEIEHSWHLPDVEVLGKFFYLSFKNGVYSVDEFVDFIYGKIVPFCVPEVVRNKLMQKFQETGDYSYIQKITDKARNLFIKKDPDLTTGEPGELILFILLEVILKAPIIACKMYLKTNQNVPVHGSDAIHVSFDSNDRMLNLYWGESKLYKDISTAIDNVCKSIAGFVESDSPRKPRDRDLEIIQDHISIDNKEMKDELLKYFDPYEPQSNNLRENFACFVGFNYTYLEDGKLDKARLIEDFESKYIKRIKSACELFNDKVNNHKISHLNFVFFLIPFKSVKELRIKFYEKLGVNYDPGIGEEDME